MIDYRENNKWTVYVHIVPKGIIGYEWDKYYVGITSITTQKRWGYNGNGYKNQVFYRAIETYGWNNIIHEIIAEHLTEHEACDMEKKLIKELMSNDRRYGYNICSGGQVCKLTEKSIEKIKKIHKNKIVSEDTKRKISENHCNVKFGNNPNAENTYQFDMNGNFIQKYDSTSFASKTTKIDRHSISVAAVNNRMAGGYLWAHDNNVIFKNDTYFLLSNTYIDKRYILFNKEVYRFTPDGKFIAVYKSCSEAGKATGIPVGTISSNARNKNKSKKFLWRYEEDIEESVENPGSFFIKERKEENA